MKKQLDKIVETRDSKYGLYFDYAIQFLILLSVISFTIETIPDLEERTRNVLEKIEIICITIFSLEYLIRLYIAKNKTTFVFSFYGLIDLLAILPFYLALGFDLRSARILRFLRLFRLIKLIRYNKAIKRFQRAFIMIKQELIMFSFVSFILFYLSAVGIYYFENAKNKTTFVFSFYGLIDLLAILPFYLALGFDLRSARILRFLRLFRLIKLIRYNKAIKRFQRAFIMIKQELIMFSFVSFILFYLSAVGIYYFENSVQPEAFSSIFSSMWWSVVTLTTVGYGDIVPITIGGRIFTFVILMLGLGIIAIPSGMISSALTEARAMEKKENQEK